MGNIQRITPKGEVDLSDVEEEGVEEQKEIDSGEDELRAEQGQAKFNAIASGFDATLAVAVDLALQSTGACGRNARKAVPANDWDTDSSDMVEPPRLAPLGGAVVQAPQAARPIQKPSTAAPSSHKDGGQARSSNACRDGGGVSPTTPPPPPRLGGPGGSTHRKAVPASPATAMPLEAELQAVKFEEHLATVADSLHKLSEDPDLAEPPHTVSDMTASKAKYAELVKGLNDIFGKLSQGEHTLKLRKAFE